jgi:hypothetical protein
MCSGPPDHRSRQWCLGPGRVLTWRDGDLVRVLDVPVPGTAAVMTFDAFRSVVVLANGETWWLDSRGGGKPIWRPGVAAAKENWMEAAKEGLALIAGGSGCGVMWAATPDRMLWTCGAGGTAMLCEAPVPGEGRILAVEVKTRTVVLEGGERFEWLGGRWFKMPSLLNAKATIRVRCLSGVGLGGGKDFSPGEELDLPEGTARGLIAAGRAEPVLP